MLALQVSVPAALFVVACARAPDPAPRVVQARAVGDEPRACASDLVCPLGSVCAKKAGAFTGECLRSVDENGAPVHVPHSVRSYGAGPDQCASTADCPARFRCDDGRCVF